MRLDHLSTEQLLGIKASIECILRDRMDYGNPERYKSNIDDRKFAEKVRNENYVDTTNIPASERPLTP